MMNPIVTVETRDGQTVHTFINSRGKAQELTLLERMMLATGWLTVEALDEESSKEAK